LEQLPAVVNALGGGPTCYVAGEVAMSYREIEPEAPLRRFVDCFWVRSDDRAGSSHASHRILPDGCIDVILDVNRGLAKVVGTMTRAVLIPALGDAQLVAVRFKPGGAVPLLGIPAVHLTDRSVPIEEFGYSDLGVRFGGDAGSSARALAELQRWLLGRQASASAPDRQVGHAVARLSSSTPPSIQALARELACSRQHLRRRFLHQVGIAPKDFARVARLQRTVAYLPHCESLAEAAVCSGYFDQAHLAREFRLLTGVSATMLRAERFHFSNPSSVGPGRLRT
jgi:AraC-like DNA-binding protein